MPDGTVLYFPDGVHWVTPSRTSSAKDSTTRMPRDLTVEGAGIDRTLIKLERLLGQRLRLQPPLQGLHDRLPERRRVRPSKQDGERVRGERALRPLRRRARRVPGLRLPRRRALLQVDCRFEGGYGSSPGNGNILRDVDVARFEDCVFDRINYTDQQSHESAFFARCDVPRLRRDMEARDQADCARESVSSHGPRFDGVPCRVDPHPRPQDTAVSIYLRRDISPTSSPAVEAALTGAKVSGFDGRAPLRRAACSSVWNGRQH